MIRLLTVFLLCVTCHGADLDTGRFLEALRLKESGSCTGVIPDGSHGERGPWQLTRTVWEQHMQGLGFDLARDTGWARECAWIHLRWLRQQLLAAEVPDSPFNLALAWNAGLDASTHGRAPVRAYQYARDVVALYEQP